MTCEIDQSGKMEDTHRLTVVAYANGQVRSLKISATEKQKLLAAMKVLDFPKRTYVYKAFAALVCLLLQDQIISSVIIDHEYPGHEPTIKGMLIHLLNKSGRSIPEIYFAHIGKSSRAHKVALEVFRGGREADLVVSAKDVLRVLY